MSARTRTVLTVLLVTVVAVPVSLPVLASASTPAIVRKINHARRAHGLPALLYAPSLQRSSRRYARHLMRIDRFAHALRIRASSRFRLLGECLGRRPGWRLRGSRMVRSWLNSPPHRAILLSRAYNRVGAAAARGRFDGHPTTIWVAQFGRL